MRCALISLGSTSSQWTFDALTRYFDRVDNIDLRKIEITIERDKYVVRYENKPLEQDYDCIFAKGSFRYATILRGITEAFYNKTYMPIVPEAFNIAHDKVLTHLILQRYKIPMPKTYLFSTIKAAKKFLEQINYPIIFKIPSGTQGKGVIYAESYAAANSMLDTLTTLKQPFLIQEHIDTGGIDYRIIVIGTKVLAYKRIAKKLEERSNIHAGGYGEKVTIDSITKNIALRTAQAIGAEICAVDILPTIHGPLVIEVNISPGLQGITKITKTNVADMIAHYLYTKSKKLKDGKMNKETKIMMKELAIDSLNKKSHSIITKLDLRGERILLPKFVTTQAKIDENKEYSIEIVENEIRIRKFS